MKQATLGFLVKRNSKNKITDVCLAMKKRGLGVDKWNGSGGKFKKSEDGSISNCLIRELKEEINVEVIKHKKIGTLKFLFDASIDYSMNVHIYLVENWKNEPSESEEMKPKWFKVENIPYEDMWEDDKYWLHHILNDKEILGTITFNKDNVIRKISLSIK